MMGLSGGQQRVLDGMAGALQTRDPRLAGMFAIFTRLNRQEPMPVIEHLNRRPLRQAADLVRSAGAQARRAPALLIIPVTLAVIACLLVLPPVGRFRGCVSGLAGRVAPQLIQRGGCAAVPPASVARQPGH